MLLGRLFLCVSFLGVVRMMQLPRPVLRTTLIHSLNALVTVGMDCYYRSAYLTAELARLQQLQEWEQQ